MKDPLKEIFDADRVDWNEPEAGHMARFEDRLNNWSAPRQKKSYRFLMAAASVVILLGLLGQNWLRANGMELKEVSYEMCETQDYFSMMINEHTEALDVYKNPEDKAIIDTVLKEMDTLEEEYKGLKIELKNSSGDVRIIHAMIGNFQHRVLLLESLLSQLKRNQELKLQDHENLHA